MFDAKVVDVKRRVKSHRAYLSFCYKFNNVNSF
jgi:hypothetical protein